MDINREIANWLKKLRDLRKQQPDTKWKIAAYDKVIPIIETWPKAITLADLDSIPGVGKSIKDHITELLTTGSIAELKDFKPSEKEGVLTLFKKIEGVGDVTANKWYDAGYRKLSDIPLDKVTYRQQVGIVLFNDFNSRIPRSDIDWFWGLLKTRYPALVGEIAGSYRRGWKDSGDIDLLVCGSNFKVVEYILFILQDIITHHLSSLEKKYMGVIKLNGIHRRLDIELALPEEWYTAIVYFTGPKDFNRYMRGQYKERGYLLDEKGVHRAGSIYHPTSEEQLFSMVGMKYLPPSERDNYATHYKLSKDGI